MHSTVFIPLLLRQLYVKFSANDQCMEVVEIHSLSLMQCMKVVEIHSLSPMQ